MTEGIIEVRNVSMLYPQPKKYLDLLFKPFTPVRRHVALFDVSFHVNRGDKIAFFGVNGAGKTTLLKLIGGLIYPSKGSIRVCNSDTVKNNAEVRKKVGFVLNEERSFYWRLTGRQNLEFFGALDNIFGKDLRDRITDAINATGLQHAADKIVASYSSGMKQRLAIARALLRDPDILILDEPTRALDPNATDEIRALISNKVSMHADRTLLIATHSFEEAKALCNKVCIIQDGKLVSYCVTEEVLSEYAGLKEYYNTFTLSQ